jgi:hypothetical protein
MFLLEQRLNLSASVSQPVAQPSAVLVNQEMHQALLSEIMTLTTSLKALEDKMKNEIASLKGMVHNQHKQGLPDGPETIQQLPQDHMTSHKLPGLQGPLEATFSSARNQSANLTEQLQTGTVEMPSTYLQRLEYVEAITRRNG